MGFPVTKCLLLGIVMGSSLTRLVARAVNIETIEAGEVARLLFLPFCCVSVGDIVASSFLLSAMRTLEQWWGSRQFASYVLTSASIALALHVAVFKATAYSPLRLVRPGPAPIVFSLLVRYAAEVPASRHLLSDKGLIYASSLWYASSCYATQPALGVVAGLVASSTRLPFRALRVPASVASAFSSLRLVLEGGEQGGGGGAAGRSTPGEIMASLHGQNLQDGPYEEQLLPSHDGWGVGGGGAGGGGGGGVLGGAMMGGMGGGEMRQRRRPVHEDALHDGGGGGVGGGLGGGAEDPLWGAGGGGGGGGMGGAPPFSPDALQSLTAMGFGEDESREALMQSGGSIEGAVVALTG